MDSLKFQNETLSGREVEILRLLAEGMSDREIAERLVMTINTVKWYNRQIYSKLGVGSRTQASARARELQLLNEHLAAAPPQNTPRKHSLPVETTHFIGRRQEKAAIKRLLDDTHLLTLVGPPGTGKTRLALQIARELADTFSEGVFFVSLASLNDPTLVSNAIASAIGVNQSPHKPLIESLQQALGEGHALLILDNFEHLLPAAPLVSALLSAVPQLKVLATSREPLHLYGEQEYVVPPLELPEPANLDPQALEACESTALFIQQARAVRPDFELTPESALAVARICAHLEGLPLAIELAAARIKLLTPSALLARLTRRLDTLTGGAHDLPARQQALRSTIEWSYNLLDEGEKVLFARLAIFAGGWSLEGAEEVCADNLSVTILDGLASLLDKNLIQQTGDDSGEPRFAMLETIREYAMERLRASGEENALRARHAAYFTVFAERTGNALLSRYRSAWLTRLETEQNNFRAVLGWSLISDPEPGLRLIAALGACWRIRSYLVEGFNWAHRLLEFGINVPPEVRANALSSTSRLLAGFLGNHDDADHMSREALDLAWQSGNQQSIAEALYARGTALMENHIPAARLCFDEALALFRELDNQWGIAQTLNVIGEVARLEGNNETAEQLYEQALSLFRELGNPWGANIVLQNLAFIAQRRNDYERARALFGESLTNSQELQDKLTSASCLVGLAGTIAALGQPHIAAQLFGAAEALRETISAQIQPGDRPDYERNLAAVRALLNPQDFDAAWQEGRALSLEQAVALTLEPELLNH